MKKLFGLLIMASLIFTAGLAVAQGDTTAMDSTGTSSDGGGWLSQLLNIRTISEIVLALFGAVILYRFNAVKAALNEIIVAAEDGSISETEFQSIVRKIKAIWGKKEETEG